MSPNQNCDMAVPVFFLIFSLMLGASAFVCNYTDCQALFKFKAGITSDPKGYIQDWTEVNPFCNWTGIACHQSLQNRILTSEARGIIKLYRKGSQSCGSWPQHRLAGCSSIVI